MRHSKRRHKLGVSGPHRSAMMGNLAVALITHGRIETTLAKAEALRPFIEKIITLAKKAENANDAARKLHFRRLAIARVRDKTAVAKLFDERVEEFVNRSGGYTRIYKLGQRVGDAAEMALIELIDGADEGYDKPKKKSAKKAGKKAAPAPSDAAAAGEVAQSEAADAGETAADVAETEASAPSVTSESDAGEASSATAVSESSAAAEKKD